MVERSREERLKELELILEAKKNINSIVTTMYSIFFSLEGFLLYGFFVLGATSARVSIAFFGASCLVGLALVTLRTKGTNDRCDARGRELEPELGAKVLLNYDNTSDTRYPTWLYRATMHGTLMAIDAVLVLMWIGLAGLSIAGKI